MPDQLLPQPPPDAPAPPAGEHALRSRRKMRWIMLIGIGSMLIVVVSMLVLLFRELASRKRHNAQSIYETFGDAQAIGRALNEFKTSYGKYPDSSTAAEVKRRTGTALTLPDQTSNDLFAQLLAAGTTNKEPIFYAQARGMRWSDMVFTTDATILAHGECGFAYIAGLSPTAISITPIAFGPVIPGTAILDQKSCHGRGVVLTIDGKVTTHAISSSGKIILPNGLELLDPRQPYWHGKAPDVRWPK